ncbi:thioredoxin family protein, partial [Enterococcus faecalis]
LFVEQDGCSSCKLVKPIINNYAKENKGIVYSVTANKEKDYNVQSEKYHIEGTPTLIYFKEGKEVYRTNTGFTEDEFKNTIKKVEF